MQEQYISFETSKIIKEKSFDEISSCCYNKNGVLVSTTNKNSGWGEIEIYSAPTQSLLQKWLREKFNIIVEVLEYYSEKDLPLSNMKFPKPEAWFCWDKYDDNFSVEEAVKFNSYEEALEFGLQETLKLI